MRARRRARCDVRTAVLVVLAAWALGVIPPSPLAHSGAATDPNVTGCEHSSNFPAPPGCPPDPTAPPEPTGAPAAAPPAQDGPPAPVVTSARFTG